MRTSRVLVLIFAFAVAAAGVWRPGVELGGDQPSAPGEAVVTRGGCGHPVHVARGGADETVRYIGVDTPESVKPDTPVQCFAKAASAFNERLVAGREVTLVSDVEGRDRYGRLLAYVYRRPDGLFVNEQLVKRGFARPLTIPPNDRYAGPIAHLAASARAAGRGLWGAC